MTPEQQSQYFAYFGGIAGILGGLWGASVGILKPRTRWSLCLFAIFPSLMLLLGITMLAVWWIKLQSQQEVSSDWRTYGILSIAYNLLALFMLRYSWKLGQKKEATPLNAHPED